MLSAESLFEKSMKSLKATNSLGGGTAPVNDAQSVVTLKGSHPLNATPSGSASVVAVMEVGRAHDAIKLMPCGDLKDFSNRLSVLSENELLTQHSALD